MGDYMAYWHEVYTIGTANVPMLNVHFKEVSTLKRIRKND